MAAQVTVNDVLIICLLSGHKVLFIQTLCDLPEGYGSRQRKCQRPIFKRMAENAFHKKIY